MSPGRTPVTPPSTQEFMKIKNFVNEETVTVEN